MEPQSPDNVTDLDEYRRRQQVELLDTTQPREVIERRVGLLAEDLRHTPDMPSTIVLHTLINDLHMVKALPDVLKHPHTPRSTVKRSDLEHLKAVDLLVHNATQQLEWWEQQGAEQVSDGVARAQEQIREHGYDSDHSTLAVALTLLAEKFPDNPYVARAKKLATLLIRELLDQQA